MKRKRDYTDEEIALLIKQRKEGKSFEEIGKMCKAKKGQQSDDKTGYPVFFVNRNIPFCCPWSKIGLGRDNLHQKNLE